MKNAKQYAQELIEQFKEHSLKLYVTPFTTHAATHMGFLHTEILINQLVMVNIAAWSAVLTERIEFHKQVLKQLKG